MPKFVPLLLMIAAFEAPCRADRPVPLARIQGAIRDGCRHILSTQRPDGAIVLNDRLFGPGRVKGSKVFPVGVTALGVLALQHAEPHLTGDLAAKTRIAINKSMGWLSQQRPELMTYSAGMAVDALCMDGPTKRRRLINTYATLLVISQNTTGYNRGFWGYRLLTPTRQGRPSKSALPLLAEGKADHSNTQLAVLGLLHASRAGFQVPKSTWRELRKHYIRVQKPDGGWHYGWEKGKRGSYATLTLVCTISLMICDEMLAEGDRHQCKMIPESPAVLKGREWIARNMDIPALDTYGMYALERYGILSGYGDIAGKDWFNEGARALLRGRLYRCPQVTGSQGVGTAFAVLFLSRGLEPIIINKLKHRGDWNNDRYDIKHLVEYISTRFQKPVQWRIVTLEADVDFLLRVPILYFNGHEALEFTDAEKRKLKAYVEKGGTIFAMACCGKKPFDASFRALVDELWPDNALQDLPKTHAIFTNPRPLTSRPKLLGMAMKGGQGRLGVIYSPHDMCCRWHKGDRRANPVFDVGANLYFYVTKVARKTAAP